jgi:hypothetical protein
MKSISYKNFLLLPYNGRKINEEHYGSVSRTQYDLYIAHMIAPPNGGTLNARI